MFTKRVKVGQADVYKDVTDWGAVFGTIVVVVIVLVVLSSFH